jgi:hypothetical protein
MSKELIARLLTKKRPNQSLQMIETIQMRKELIKKILLTHPSAIRTMLRQMIVIIAAILRPVFTKPILALTPAKMRTSTLPLMIVMILAIRNAMFTQLILALILARMKMSTLPQMKVMILVIPKVMFTQLRLVLTLVKMRMSTLPPTLVMILVIPKVMFTQLKQALTPARMRMSTLPLMIVMILVILNAMFMLLTPALILTITFPVMMILRQAMLPKIIKMLRLFMMTSLEARATLTMKTLGHSTMIVTLSPMMTWLLCNGTGASLETVETTTDTTWVIPTSALTRNSVKRSTVTALPVLFRVPSSTCAALHPILPTLAILIMQSTGDSDLL